MTGLPSRVWPILDNRHQPDDEQTDVAAWLAKQWDDLHTTTQQPDPFGCDLDLPDTLTQSPGDGVGEQHGDTA